MTAPRVLNPYNGPTRAPSARKAENKRSIAGIMAPRLRVAGNRTTSGDSRLTAQWSPAPGAGPSQCHEASVTRGKITRVSSAQPPVSTSSSAHRAPGEDRRSSHRPPQRDPAASPAK